MRRLYVTALLLVGLPFLDGSPATACGDKFLLVGRGARFQRAYAAVHPASILVYARPNADKTSSVADPQLLSALKLAGHKLQMLTDAAKVRDVLGAGGYDLVLTDFSDVAALDAQVQAAPSKPVLVPVMYKPTKAEVAAAEQQFACLLKASDRLSHSLGAIDDAMKVRVEGARARSSKTP